MAIKKVTPRPKPSRKAKTVKEVCTSSNFVCVCGQSRNNESPYCGHCGRSA